MREYHLCDSGALRGEYTIHNNGRGFNTDGQLLPRCHQITYQYNPKEGFEYELLVDSPIDPSMLIGKGSK